MKNQKPTYCPETPVYKDEKITIGKIDDKSNLADYKKSEVKNLKDFNPGNLKNGYIYMTDKGTFFFIKKDDNTIEYYNRWGLRVNENGEETTKRDFRNLIEVDEKP